MDRDYDTDNNVSCFMDRVVNTGTLLYATSSTGNTTYVSSNPSSSGWINNYLRGYMDDDINRLQYTPDASQTSLELLFGYSKETDDDSEELDTFLKSFKIKEEEVYCYG